jgi:hypothetical protein
VALSSCGGSSHRTPRPSAFAWFAPSQPPATWRAAQTAHSTLAYPPGWQRVASDLGAASAALRGDVFAGYLNATPKQGAETLAGWARFRLGRNREEGDRAVRALASARNLSFSGGRGSCLIDEYRAAHGPLRYREIACYVQGTRGSGVVVAAAQVRDWARRSVALEQAISHFAID